MGTLVSPGEIAQMPQPMIVTGGLPAPPRRLAAVRDPVAGRGAATGLVIFLTGLIALDNVARTPAPSSPPKALRAPGIAATTLDGAAHSTPVVRMAPAAVVSDMPAAPTTQPGPVAPTIAPAQASPAVPMTGPLAAAAVTANPPLGQGSDLDVPPAPALSTALDRQSSRQPAMDRTVAMGGLLPANRILAYYGHPHDPNMGILGEYEKDDLLAILRKEAATYAAADPSRPVIPAFEVIATVAQNWPTESGHYLLDTDMKTLTEYADFTEANGMLLFLDLQIGRNTVPAEIAKILPLLERPHVHLALDPEFAIAEGQEPGTHIGELTAGQIAEAQAILSQLVRERNLPPKILIVHQFVENMVLGKQDLQPYPGVQVVIESDGFGTPALKKQVYRVLITNDEYEYSGIKHFYRQDNPVMSAADTIALDPAPHLVIYQ